MLMAAAADMCTMPGIRDTMDPPLPTRVLIFVPSSWKPILCFNLDAALEIINSFTYKESAYVHQGWFSEDHTTLYADDELDEEGLTTGTDYSAFYAILTDLDGISHRHSTDDPVTTFDRPQSLRQGPATTFTRPHTLPETRVHIKIMDDAALKDPFDGEQACECTRRPDDCGWTSLEYRSAIL
jgi:hypothetical protein